MSTDEEFKVYNLDNNDTAELYGIILVKLKFLIDFFSKKLWFPKAKPWAIVATSETLRLKSAFFCKAFFASGKKR